MNDKDRKLLNAVTSVSTLTAALALTLCFVVVNNDRNNRDELSLHAQRISGKIKKIENFLNEKKNIEEDCLYISKEYFNNARVEVDLSGELIGHCHINPDYSKGYIGTPYELKKLGEEKAMKDFYYKNRDK